MKKIYFKVDLGMAMIGRIFLVTFGFTMGCLVENIRKTEKEIKELQKENERLDEILKSIKI